MFKFENGDIVIKNKNLVLVEGSEKAKQDIVELIKLINESYFIRKNLGVEWLDYLGNLSEKEQDDFIITAMRDRIMNYNGVIPESVDINLEKKVNRKAFFKISLIWNDEEINIDTTNEILGVKGG